MGTPKREDVLHRARALAIEKQVRQGLPAITPTERELKEVGAWKKAKLDLMRVDQHVQSEQRHYLQDMASEMRLTIIPFKGLSTLKRETGYEWTNGWTKHKKPRKPSKEFINGQIKHLMGRFQKASPKAVERIAVMHEINKLERGIITPIQQDIWESRQKSKPKRKKSHVGRTGKTMRALRKVNGVKMFAFPDDVWKVKKPRKRRKR